jgi:hypothetical protein
MIKEKKIKIKGHSRNIKYYKSFGYDISVGKYIDISVEHLSKGTSSKITCICQNCNKEVSNGFKDYWNYTNGLSGIYYCNSCKKIKSEKTSLKKYGVKNPMQSEEVKQTLKKSLLDKYNVSHYSKTKEWKDKFVQTSLDRYGVTNPSKSIDVINKIKETNQKNLGVDWSMQSKSTISKSRKSFNDKYGVDWISKSDYYKDKIKETSIEKWGVSNYSKTIEYKEKVKSTNFSNWGGHPSKNENFKLKAKNTKQRKTFKRYAELISDKYILNSYKNETFSLIHKECNNTFDINKGLLRARFNSCKMICTQCNPVGVLYSNFETQVGSFIESLGIGYIKNDKKILKGKEIDIYIPEYNIAIECNGIYWHSELFKSSDYHISKTNKCNEEGISLLHIWEDDWDSKKEIIKSIIRNRLGKVNNRIYARKCDIREVNTKDYKLFLNNNHIQGYASSSINLGLYFNDELVSLMTFGWRRTNNKKEYELIRFCNELNTSVIGGASKLFKYFVDNTKFEYLISYADISLFGGGVYKKLGFVFDTLSKPNYFWVINGKRIHRYNYSKRKLVKQGFDKDKTELEIMNERGYYRIFSTGQEKWLYKS